MSNLTDSKRLLIIFLLIVATQVLLWSRLFDVTVRRGHEFLSLSQNNRQFTRRYPAERGIILDRYGEPLVYNQKVYFQYADPQALYSDKLAIEMDEALSRMATDSASVGYDFDRVYPHKEALATALGYVSMITAEDLADNRSLALTSRLGRTGLEAVFDNLLASQPSLAKFEVNALGKTQRLLSTTAATYGRNLQSTLDAQLSTLAYQAMKGKQGAVVILDAKNGAVLTLLSAPSFDPNLFNDSKLHQKEIRAYLQDERKVFFNRALSGSYPPGSVFKLVTAVAALQESAIDADSQVQDEGVLKVGDFSYANWYYTQYGRVEGAVDLQKALARSNDIFFYKAAEWLGPTKLANYSRMFGLGERSGIEAMSENRGLVPDPAWKEKQRGEPWYLGNTYHFGIGQGDLLVSPLQVASMTQAIANQGVLCQPTLLSEKAVQCRSLALDQDNVDQVIKGMVSACSSGGTAYPIFPLNEKYPNLVACKTGTAEFGAADDRGYRPTHAWLTAIVNLLPEQLPHLPRQLIITVLVESDEAKIYREGSQDAAPVVAEILIGLGL